MPAGLAAEFAAGRNLSAHIFDFFICLTFLLVLCIIFFEFKVKTLDFHLIEVVKMETIFPLEQLIGFKDNIYMITVAASRRAYQMSKINDPEIERNAGKAVSLAARQLFCKKVTYRIEDASNR